MLANISKPAIGDSAETLADCAGVLLTTRSIVLRHLLKQSWIWQVPPVGQWVVRQALRTAKTSADRAVRCDCRRYGELVELVRAIVCDRALLRPLVERYPNIGQVVEQLDRDPWLKVEIASYYADKLRELEHRERESVTSR
ncbi:hypothetical protein AY599_26955 [Leptolyngbya valderiana BDU 20041]|nr:hypothetical protein [Geitlerinema sp. CS-897]OAB61462.1 hypothetical protein AY599_26955 [Leptolyngbya valderiana BDU 20041]